MWYTTDVMESERQWDLPYFPDSKPFLSIWEGGAGRHPLSLAPLYETINFELDPLVLFVIANIENSKGMLPLTVT